jgi:DNA-binding CsgD family transcriptional regulator
MKAMNNNSNFLTTREKEILRMIVNEHSTKEIARCLLISPRTVETHRKNIQNKLNTKSIVGLVKYALEQEL